MTHPETSAHTTVASQPSRPPARAGFVEHAGYRTIPMPRPEDALAFLEGGTRIALVTSGIRMPSERDGLTFIRTVWRRRPEIPLAVIAMFPSDLDPLSDTPDRPILVLTKPVGLKQIPELLRLVGPPRGGEEALPRPR